MQSPRIESLAIENLSTNMLNTLSQIPGDALKSHGFPSNVLGTLLHNPKVLELFLTYWVSSKHDLSFSVREQELIILRMGRLYESEYVWKHHVLVGLEFGITEKELKALSLQAGAFEHFSNDIPSTFTFREAALVALTDELVEKRTISAEAWSKFCADFSPQTIVDLISLVSQYTLFALVNNTAQVVVEDSVKDLPSFRM